MSNSTAMGSPANWRGYLLANGAGGTFPHYYIKMETYDIQPDIREEVRAYRDDYTRDLYRLTAPGMKSKITFEILDNLSMEQSYEIQNFFYAAEVDHLQRKVQIIYWNPEYFRYDVGYFYRPDTNFKVRDIDGGIMTLKGHPITLIEY